jgi:rubrerythrin
MAQTDTKPKDNILAEFETMKSFELSARDLYSRIAADPGVRQKKVRDTFALLAKEEQQHADVVQEIIEIVRKAL